MDLDGKASKNESRNCSVGLIWPALLFCSCSCSWLVPTTQTQWYNLSTQANYACHCHRNICLFYMNVQLEPFSICTYALLPWLPFEIHCCCCCCRCLLVVYTQFLSIIRYMIIRLQWVTMHRYFCQSYFTPEIGRAHV